MKHAPTAKLPSRPSVAGVLCPLPPALDTAALAPRLQRMVALLLTHEALICEYNVGVVELHFHRDGKQDSVKPKITLCPSS